MTDFCLLATKTAQQCSGGTAPEQRREDKYLNLSQQKVKGTAFERNSFLLKMEDSDCNSSYAENESSECDSSDGDSDSEGFSDSQAEETDGSDVDATTSEDEVDEDEREEYSSANMRRRIKRLEEDEEEADDDDSPVKRPQGKKSKSRMILSSDEEEEGGAGAGGVSSGDDAGQTCTICLLKFESQELGFPSSCSHVFCADCITEWTANVPTCPIDRKSIRSVWGDKRALNSCVVSRATAMLTRKVADFEFEVFLFPVEYYT